MFVWARMHVHVQGGWFVSERQGGETETLEITGNHTLCLLHSLITLLITACNINYNLTH